MSIAIIQATRTSANAVKAMAKWSFRVRDIQGDIDRLRDRIGRDGCRSLTARHLADKGIAAQEARLKEARRNLKPAETRHANAQTVLNGTAF